MKKILAPVIFIISCAIVVLTGCAQDPYKDYVASGLAVKQMEFDYDDMDNFSFGYNKAELFTDYREYLKYNFDLSYTESYFEQNNLLVFSVMCNSSDGMEFSEVLQDNHKLFPLFFRNEIKDGDPVTDDMIVLSYYAEVSKNEDYSIGKIIYRYR